jgi:hypothetical protein
MGPKEWILGPLAFSLAALRNRAGPTPRLGIVAPIRKSERGDR